MFFDLNPFNWIREAWIMTKYTALVLLWVNLAIGQAAAPHTPGRIVTTTRLVAMFSELENQLLNAVHNKDQAALDKFLSDEFQVWRPKSDPVPREDWVKQAESENAAGSRIENMAVRGLNDDTSVASFVLTESSEATKRPIARQYFVVDVWQKTAQGWRLTDRYISDFKSTSGSMAGHDIKPTGKN